MRKECHRSSPGLLPVLFLLCAAVPALATDYTSVQNGPWGNAATWSPPGVPDSSVDNVTVNHAVTVDGSYMFGNLLIGASGNVVCSGDYTLWPFGNWANNGRATLTAGAVEFVGPGDGSISGDSITPFYKLVITKQALDVKVTMHQSARVRATGLGSLNVQTGTLVTNGQDLDCDVENSVVGGGANGKLDITGDGTVSMWMLQQDGLGYVSVSDNAILNISSWQFTMGTCRFEVSGGQVNYTQENGWNMRIFGSSPPGFGYIVTGGTVTFYGDVVSSVWSYFDVSGSGVIRFAGSSNSRFDLLNAFGGVGWAHWALNDLRIEKTGGATVLITASGTTMMDSSVTIAKGVTVNPDAQLVLSNPLFNGTFGFIINDIDNRGVLVDSDYTYVSGHWDNTGTFEHGDNLVTFDGAGTDTVTAGSGPFYDVFVAKPSGRLVVDGNLAVEHYLTSQNGVLALKDTLTMGTGSSSGTITVSGGTLSAVGTTSSGALVRPVAAGFPYRCAVAPAGTVGARYAAFENMDTLGIDIAGSIDPTDNFSFCRFDHGTLSGRMIRVSNSQVVDDISGLSFAGSAGYNIEKLNSSGHITVNGGSGNRWGEQYENDPNNLVDWTGAGVELVSPTIIPGSSFSVTPNPLRPGYATVRLGTRSELSSNSVMSLRVYDAAGRCVLRSPIAARTSSIQLDLRTMPAGVYTLKLSTDDSNATCRLVVQR